MIYFIESLHTGAIKIGKADDVSRRYQQIRTSSPEPLELIGAIPGGSVEEKEIHARFSDFRVHGEWFRDREVDGETDSDGRGGFREDVFSLLSSHHFGTPYRTGIDDAIKAGRMDWGNGEPYGQVLCPVCGFEYQHAEEPTASWCDDYSQWQGRGGLVKIPFWGECGCLWDICFGFHKGETAAFAMVRLDCRAYSKRPLVAVGIGA